MKNILIINLKRFGDIFQSTDLINSMISSDSGIKIHYLCFEEFASGAKVLENVEKVHTVNRKKIISYYKNSIYSDGLSLNELEVSLSSVKNLSFDVIFNYSNDRVSTYLTSYLKGEHTTVQGIEFTSKQTVSYSNSWSIAFNDIVTQTRFIGHSFSDLYKKIGNISGEDKKPEIKKIKSNKAHDNTALENLNKLRLMKNSDPNRVSIVGFQISSSSKSKDIPFKLIKETMTLMSEDPDMVPILLIAPNDTERQIANKLNNHFDNKLVSVEADFIALPSVLKNLDLLVTPDTAIKHLADALDTPLIEFSLGASPIFKQGSLNPKSIIVTEPPHLRTFSIEENKNTDNEERFKHLDTSFLYNLIKGSLGLESDSTTYSSTELCLYKPMRMDGAEYIAPITGPYNDQFEIKRLMSRVIINSLFDGPESDQARSFLKENFDPRDLTIAIESEKVSLSALTRDLLSTLRGLIQTQENKEKVPVFIESLEKLLSHCYENTLASIPALIFRAKVESLTSTSMQENMKEVESLLYKLKDNIQGCLKAIKSIEEFEKDIRIQRSNRHNQGVQV